MSTVALLVNDFGRQSTKCISLLTKAFSLSIGSVRNAVKSGVPLIEHKLFDRATPMFPQTLLEVLERLDELGADWEAIELLDGQKYPCAEARFRITAINLRNMITSRKESLQDQRAFGEFEDGSD